MGLKYAELILDLVSTLQENIEELRARKNFADPEELNYIEGKLQAYAEILGALQASANDLGITINE